MYLTPDLTDNTTGWTMQPGHVLFAALYQDIRDRLSDCLYTLPILSGRPDKIESIAALCSVLSESVKEIKRHLEIAKGLQNIWIKSGVPKIIL